MRRLQPTPGTADLLLEQVAANLAMPVEKLQDRKKLPTALFFDNPEQPSGPPTFLGYDVSNVATLASHGRGPEPDYVIVDVKKLKEMGRQATPDSLVDKTSLLGGLMRDGGQDTTPRRR